MFFVKKDIAKLKINLLWVKSLFIILISFLSKDVNFFFLHYIIIVYILTVSFWILYDLAVLVGVSLNNTLVLSLFDLKNFKDINFLLNIKSNILKNKLLAYMGNSLMVKL